MDQIAVVLMHSGRWTDENDYEDYEMEAIAIRESTSYIELVELIRKELDIDLSRKTLRIEYKVDFSNKPMWIHNDMGVKVYVMARKEERGFGMYPLCITVLDNIPEDVTSYLTYEVGENSGVELIENFDAMDVDETQALTITEAPILIQNDLEQGIISDPLYKEIAVEQVYNCKATLKSVMREYGVLNQMQFRTTKSNSFGYTLTCKAKGCTWYMRSSDINKSGLFKIRKLCTEHSCPLKDRVNEKIHFNSNLVRGLVKPKFSNHKRKYSAKEIQEDMKKDYGVDVSYMLAWRAREMALIELRGTTYASYSRLPAYLYTLSKTYPGSHIDMKKTDKNEFLYVYISLHSFIKGFDFCKPIVVVDGSFLRGTYNGTFVSASTVDGSGHIFPLAYGILDSENDASWTWFFENFRQAYGKRPGMCVVSDRHESIIKAVSQVYNNVPHYACIFHLWQNVCKNFKGSRKRLTNIFYAMAKSYKRTDFDRLMQKVEKSDVRVKEYLQLAGYERWARAFAPVSRGWTMTSNIAETINKILYIARELPIYSFLEEVRKLFGRWNYTNRQAASFTFTTICGTYHDILTSNKLKSARMTVIPSTDFVYTVLDKERQFIVCIEKKTCSCFRFQVDQIPCAHACAVLNSKNFKEDSYCSDLYKPVTVMNTYQLPISPLPDDFEWEIPESVMEEIVLPPKFKRPPGRPKNKDREKSAGELFGKHSTNSCSTCGFKGHNRRTCSKAPRNE